ncbi:MAG: YqgE/AlgH family protein [Marinicaulis sp.]|nr:YqgE/AlgH family protein [Marinicaulis sp.]
MDKSASPFDTQDFLAGQLLIAMPNMGDPRFEHSVIFMCTHDEDHAMGAIVNKPLTDITLSTLLAQLEIDTDENAIDAPVFFGGPVQTQRGVVLHSLDYKLESTIEFGGAIGLTASQDVLIDIGGRTPARNPPQHYLLALGHAGWGAGQLEREISMNVWAHCAPDETTIFDGDMKSSWKRALGQLGVTGAMLSPEWAAPRRQDQPLN